MSTVFLWQPLLLGIEIAAAQPTCMRTIQRGTMTKEPSPPATGLRKLDADDRPSLVNMRPALGVLGGWAASAGRLVKVQTDRSFAHLNTDANASQWKG